MNLKFCPLILIFLLGCAASKQTLIKKGSNAHYLASSIERVSESFQSYLNEDVYSKEEYPETFILTPETIKELSRWQYIPLDAEAGFEIATGQYETIEKTLHRFGLEGKYDPLSGAGQLHWEKQF